METITVAVGSINPVKIKAACQAVSSSLNISIENIICLGFNVLSEVPNQPFGDEQTKLGALNRAKHAFYSFKRKEGSNPNYAVGMEGGVSVLEEENLECFAWIVIVNGSNVGSARTASFSLPSSIGSLVLNGMELGDADDKIFATRNSKQGDGTVGHLTHNIINRLKYYEHAVILAMIPFLWNSLYSDSLLLLE